MAMTRDRMIDTWGEKIRGQFCRLLEDISRRGLGTG